VICHLSFDLPSFDFVKYSFNNLSFFLFTANDVNPNTKKRSLMSPSPTEDVPVGKKSGGIPRMVETDLDPSVISASDDSFRSKDITSETFVCDAEEEDSFDPPSYKSASLNNGTCAMADDNLSDVGDNRGLRAKSESSKTSDRLSKSHLIILDDEIVQDGSLINNGTRSVEISSDSVSATAEFGVITSTKKIEDYLRDRGSSLPSLLPVSKGMFVF